MLRFVVLSAQASSGRPPGRSEQSIVHPSTGNTSFDPLFMRLLEAHQTQLNTSSLRVQS